METKEKKEQIAMQDYSVENAKIVDVFTSKFDTNRISIKTNKKFIHYNEKGEITETDTFGINTFALLQQAESVEILQLAKAVAMGKKLNPQLFSLVLLNSVISFDRLHKLAGENREFDKGIYEQDAFTTKITKIKTDIKPMFESMIMRIISTNPIIEEKAIANPWD